MLTNVNPKLPMREKAVTKKYYVEQLGFSELNDYGDYLLMEKDKVEIHFFEFKELNPKEITDKFISEQTTLTIYISLC